MTDVTTYLDAATRENTRRSYQSALRHYELAWRGHLPATPDSVVGYLVRYAGELAINTLKQRLAALAQWHNEHGFPDPTRALVVRKVLKGIRVLHPSAERKALPLQLTQLAQVSDWLEHATAAALDRQDAPTHLRHLRDRALILLGFWRGFRSDELVRLQIPHIKLVTDQGMTCFLPRTKGDRQDIGTTFKVPALSQWCAVAATSAWIDAASLTTGPVFRSIDRWGDVREGSLHPNSVIPLLRRLFRSAALTDADLYSGHSFRRGFAGWANANGWDVKTLMEHVGWRDVQSAMRYIDGSDAFSQNRIESGLRALRSPDHHVLPPPAR